MRGGKKGVGKYCRREEEGSWLESRKKGVSWYCKRGGENGVVG